ncbi:MAG: sulfotransferase [Bacteroidia bacterium]
MSVQPKHIFIGGPNRSGTTFLQKLLVLHSEIKGGPEFDFLPNLLRIYRRMKTDFHLQRQGYYYNEEKLRVEWYHFLRGMIDRQHPPAPPKESGVLRTLKGGVSEPAVPSDEAAQSHQLGDRGVLSKRKTQNAEPRTRNPEPGTQNAEPKTYLSEKTPDNIYVARELLEIFPEGVFIYMYRDGRDVLNSLKKVKQRMKQDGKQPKLKISLHHEAMRWNSSQKRYRELRKDGRFSGRHFAIQYEALLRNPQEELQKLMAFLGLELEPQQLKPEQFGSEQTQSVVDTVWYTEAMYRQPFETKNIGKWQQGMSWQEKLMANVLMGEELARAGYSYSTVALKMQQLLKGAKIK